MNKLRKKVIYRGCELGSKMYREIVMEMDKGEEKNKRLYEITSYGKQFRV